MMKTSYVKMLCNAGLMLLAVFVLNIATATPSYAVDCGGLPVRPDGTCECPKKERQEMIEKAISSHEILVADKINKTWTGSLESTAKLKNIVDIKVHYCMGKFDTAFKSIQDMLISFISAIINQLIQEILDWVCSAVAAIISDILNMICLPLIDFPPSLSLPGEGRSTCSGYSLEDVIKIPPAPFMEFSRPPADYIMYPMSRGLDDDE